MRNRHRIAAAGALIGLAAIASWWAGVDPPGSGREGRHQVVSAGGGPDGLGQSAGALLQGDSHPRARASLEPGEGAARIPDPSTSRSPLVPEVTAETPPVKELRAAPSAAPESAAESAAESAGSAQPLAVLSAERIPERATGEILGMDPYGPRPLTLWELAPEGGRAAALAGGESAADGRFRFPLVLLPQRRVRLVVTLRGLGPGDPGASAPFEIAEGPGPPYEEGETR